MIGKHKHIIIADNAVATFTKKPKPELLKLIKKMVDIANTKKFK